MLIGQVIANYYNSLRFRGADQPFLLSLMEASNQNVIDESVGALQYHNKVSSLDFISSHFRLHHLHAAFKPELSEQFESSFQDARATDISPITTCEEMTAENRENFTSAFSRNSSILNLSQCYDNLAQYQIPTRSSNDQHDKKSSSQARNSVNVFPIRDKVCWERRGLNDSPINNQHAGALEMAETNRGTNFGTLQHLTEHDKSDVKKLKSPNSLSENKPNAGIAIFYSRS